MIRVITSSTHRSYREAVVQAGNVPGLQADLAGAHEQLTTSQAQHDQDQEQLTAWGRARAEDARTIESLQGQIALLRAAALEAAGVLAGDREPKSAAYRTAGAFVANADLFGITGAQGTPVLAALRGMGSPREVHVLLKRGTPLSAHLSRSEAREAAGAQGADPDGWGQAATSLAEARTACRAAWAIASMQLDVAAPWMTLGTTPSSVFVVLKAGGLPHSAHSTEETARGLAADAGITVTGQSLVRVRVGGVLSPAAV